MLIVCPLAAEVWSQCYRWLGWTLVLPGDCKSHMVQHYFPSLTAKQNCIIRFVWFAVAGTIWSYRNRLVFRDGAVQEGTDLMESAQYRAWLLLKGKVKGFHFSFYEWISEPIICIKSVA